VVPDTSGDVDAVSVSDLDHPPESGHVAPLLLRGNADQFDLRKISDIKEVGVRGKRTPP